MVEGKEAVGPMAEDRPSVRFAAVVKSPQLFFAKLCIAMIAKT